jgi:hypothetical protein
MGATEMTSPPDKKQRRTDLSRNGTWGSGGARVRPKFRKKEGNALLYFETCNPQEVYVVVVWDGETWPSVEPCGRLLFKHRGERTFKKEQL